MQLSKQQCAVRVVLQRSIGLWMVNTLTVRIDLQLWVYHNFGRKLLLGK